MGGLAALVALVSGWGIVLFTLIILLCIIGAAWDVHHQRSYAWLGHYAVYGALWSLAATIAAAAVG